MQEIHPNLFVGDQNDYENTVKFQPGWCVVHACREPYHRKTLGYTGRGAPKDHPEYLVARRGHRLILNLLDMEDPAYIPEQIITVALKFIDDSLKLGSKVLVHCNQGGSRSPVLGMLYLLGYTDVLAGEDFETVEQQFKEKYPPYSPANGMREVARKKFYENREIRK